MDRRGFLNGMSAAALAPLAFYGAGSWAEVLQRSPATSAHPHGAPLSDEQIRLVGALSEGIIPTTDTPGAVTAGVPQFMSLLYQDWFNDEERLQFTLGLQSVDTDSRRSNSCRFVDCDAQQQSALLNEWDATAFAARQSRAPLTFFARFKELTLIGYYTSKIGQEKELKTALDAGENDACGPVMMAPPFQL